MSRKDKPKLPPKRVLQIAERLQAGERLHCQYRPRAIGDADDVRTWWFEPSGDVCGPVSARQAIEAGLIVPVDTGLFGDSDAQTFVAAQA